MYHVREKFMYNSLSAHRDLLMFVVIHMRSYFIDAHYLFGDLFRKLHLCCIVHWASCRATLWLSKKSVVFSALRNDSDLNTNYLYPKDFKLRRGAKGRWGESVHVVHDQPRAPFATKSQFDRRRVYLYRLINEVYHVYRNI
jgi:hypothetical protein